MASDGQIAHRLGDAYARERGRAVLAQVDTAQRVDQSTTRQGNIREEAVASAISVPIALDVAGALSAANDIGPARWAVQAVTIWQVRARVKTAPSGGECTLWLAADGTRIASVTIQAGATSGVSPVAADVDPGAMLTVDATVVNGAADLSLQIATRPRGS